MGKRTRIRGALDADRLVRAFDAVVTASDALRMTVEPGGERGRILERPPTSTEVIELSASELEGWSTARIAEPIDAANCVYDSVLIRHADDDWTWWLDLHHVATDAAGSALVYAATAAVYDQLATSDEPDLSGLVVGDFFAVAADLERAPGGARRLPSVPTPGGSKPTSRTPGPDRACMGRGGLRTTWVPVVRFRFGDDERARLGAVIAGPYRSISRESVSSGSV